MMTNAEPHDRGQNHSRVRASDAERETVADRLRSAVTDGRLTLDECDERLAALYTMKFRDELPSLTHDLPGEPSNGPQDGRRDRGPSGWNLARPPWPFRVIPVVMLLIIIGIIISSLGGHFFWPIIPLFFLFMAFSRHAFFRACHRRWAR